MLAVWWRSQVYHHPAAHALFFGLNEGREATWVSPCVRPYHLFFSAELGGYISLSLENLTKFIGHKIGYTATGCTGRLTWLIGTTGRYFEKVCLLLPLKTITGKCKLFSCLSRYISVMYSIPFSHDLYSNWLAVGIHGKEQLNSSSLFHTVMK